MYSTQVNQINDEKKDNNELQTTITNLNPLKRDDNEKPQIFIWGKATPRNMFPQNRDQLAPWKCDSLTSHQIYNITAAREGSHCFGIGKNNWLFAWGETKQIGALGLGNNSCSTSPFYIRSLSKKHVIEVACSSIHGLCITNDMNIYGWGNKLLTLLPNNTLIPKQLNYLNNKGINKLIASNTHSLAYNNNSLNIYSFGINGSWLGLNNEQQIFGKMKIHIPSNKQVKLCISHADCSSQYTIIVLNNGFVGVCGINEHGRMGLGKSVYKTCTITWNNNLKDIIFCSSGSFHSGYIDINGNVYTCGIGNNYRHGHSHINTIWIPQIIKSLKNKFKIYSIECVNERTYIITNNGNLIMFGKEPISGRTHSKPFIFNYLKHIQIYKICATKHFCVAIGYIRKQIIKPNIMPNPSVDPMEPDQVTQNTNELIATVINNNHTKCVHDGNHVKESFGNFIRLEQVQYTNNNNNVVYNNNSFNNNSMPINNGVNEVFGNFIGTRQVTHNNGSNYCPPMNVVYGGMNIPPPPPLPNTQSYQYGNDCVPKQDTF